MVAGQYACGENSGIVYRNADGRTISRSALADLPKCHPYDALSSNAANSEARALFEKARDAADIASRLELWKKAADLAPDWPLPVYLCADHYLQLGDTEAARTYYAKVLQISPRGFGVAVRAHDTLCREAKGEFPKGLYRHFYKVLTSPTPLMPKDQWEVEMDMIARQNNFAPGFLALAQKTDSEKGRKMWVEAGLAAKPDPETRGQLLIMKAQILDKGGERSSAIAILGELVLDKNATLDVEYAAKGALRDMVSQ